MRQARLGRTVRLKNFTGEVRIKDRGWFVRLKNLFRPQEVLFVVDGEGEVTIER